MSRFKGWRTYLITTVLPIAAVAVNATMEVFEVDAAASWSVIAMAILAAVMRTVTSTAPGKSG